MTLEEEVIQAVQQGVHSLPAARLNFLHQQLIGGYPERWYCTTCPGKMRAVFASLKMRYFNKNTTIMSKSPNRYSLKSGKGFRPFGSAEVITAENLTDERAEKLIQQYPELASRFDVNEDVPSPVLEGEKPTEKESLQIRYEELYNEKPADSLTIRVLKEKIAEAEKAQ